MYQRTFYCSREEDSNSCTKGHFTAAEKWRLIHYWIGIPSAIITGIASVSAFGEQTTLAGILAMLVAASGAVSTFLNPEGKAIAHSNAGNNYLILRNRLRRFRNIEMPNMEETTAKEQILTFAQQKEELNSASPLIPQWAYNIAKKNIAAGQTQYGVDEKDKEN